MKMTVTDAQDRVILAVLRVLQAERAGPHADSAADAEYADDQLALAARDLARAVDAIDEAARPVGWSE